MFSNKKYINKKTFIKNGLVGSWDFSNGSPGYVYDQSGYGNNAQSKGVSLGSEISWGKNSKSISLNGENNYFEIIGEQIPSSLILEKNFAFCAWIKFKSKVDKSCIAGNLTDSGGWLLSTILVGGYWKYATKSNDAPGQTTINLSGDGNVGSIGNFVNYNDPSGTISNVGTNGGPSYYGTFDQSGNVSEWTDTLVEFSGPDPNKFFVVRGGAYEDDNNVAISSSWKSFGSPQSFNNALGFRICTLNNPLKMDNFATILDPGNEPDLVDGKKYGKVDYIYKIGKYEVTNNEYVEFLNCVGSLDTYNLYNVSMGGSSGGILRDGDQGHYTYSVKPQMGNKPVVFISWFNAARYCNWLTNGKPQGNQTNSTTEDGVYSLFGTNSNFVARNSNFGYWLPNENEWYKSAYYDPTSKLIKLKFQYKINYTIECVTDFSVPFNSWTFISVVHNFKDCVKFYLNGNEKKSIFYIDVGAMCGGVSVVKSIYQSNLFLSSVLLSGSSKVLVDIFILIEGSVGAGGVADFSQIHNVDFDNSDYYFYDHLDLYDINDTQDSYEEYSLKLPYFNRKPSFGVILGG